VAYFEIDVLELNKFDEKAELIYESHKEEWEKLYNGKIIAIGIDANDLESVGSTLEMSI
jgi:tRNA threonylcarbamoyladenosine modification (KEOPS) complex  Pcc1 subunit